MFLERLAAIQSRMSPAARDLSTFFFVVVSETMISGTLSKVPKDTNVAFAVRHMLDDHAKDEGRHHTFFSNLFSNLWPQLSRTQKLEMSPHFPEFIRAFIDPDIRAMTAILTDQGFDHEECQQIIHDTYSPSHVGEVARNASVATVRLFERHGVLEDSRTREAFFANGLLAGNGQPFPDCDRADREYS
jgi:hypothetical protein